MSMRTYGSLELKNGNWVVKTEPHIALRIKRLFAKVDKDCDGIVLSDSFENCKDLLWFLDRYPLEVSKLDLQRLKRNAKKFEEKILTLENILSGKYEFKKVEMAIPPREYQLQAAELWLKSGFLLLGDEVGVGKTASAICGLVNPIIRPSLVVTLAHLTGQWREEIRKFAPQLKSHVLKSTLPYELADKQGIKPDVIICNYHKLNGWVDVLSGQMKSIVFDECQELRCGDSAKYAAAVQITRKSKYAILMSGTPIYNAGDEMWNVLNVAKEDALGTKAEFDREWCGIKGRVKDPKAFGSFLREQGLMLRRTRADVKRELPPLTNIPYEIECDPMEIDKVKGSASELAKLILSEAPAKQGDHFHAAGKFDVIMRQATGIAKAPYVADFVKMLVEGGESVVLFGWHRAVYDIWTNLLGHLKPAMYTGEESGPQKDESKRRFVERETPVMIVSLRSGAGLDGLQHVCRTGVFGELDWSPGVSHQCTGRIFRDGQKDPVTMYYLTSTEGTDPVMIDILGIKKQQIEGINNPFSNTIELITNTTDHMKKLAEHYLRSIGEEIPDPDGYEF